MKRTLRSSGLPTLAAVATLALLGGVGCSTQPGTYADWADPDTRPLRAHVSIDEGSWALSPSARAGVTATGAAGIMGASSGPVAGGYTAFARLQNADTPAATPASAFAEVPTP
ncbi:MAG: hypothetical protein AAF078_04130 [Planctomycetota bacterium]